MRRRTQAAYSLNLPARVILRELLCDFEDNNREANDLRQSYQGPSFQRLKQVCIDLGISIVDFDLAIDDLDRNGLVKTGPPEISDSASFGGVLILPGIYSKREYAYLKEDGYREAKRLASSNEEAEHVSKPVSHRKGAVVYGDQINNYGTVGAIGQNSVGTVKEFHQCWQRIESRVDLAKLAAELGILRSELARSAIAPDDYAQLALVAQAEKDANSSDGPGVMKTLSRVAKTVFETAERIGTDLAAKVIVEAAKG